MSELFRGFFLEQPTVQKGRFGEKPLCEANWLTKTFQSPHSTLIGRYAFATTATVAVIDSCARILTLCLWPPLRNDQNWIGESRSGGGGERESLFDLSGKFASALDFLLASWGPLGGSQTLSILRIDRFGPPPFSTPSFVLNGRGEWDTNVSPPHRIRASL